MAKNDDSKKTIGIAGVPLSRLLTYTGGAVIGALLYPYYPMIAFGWLAISAISAAVDLTYHIVKTISSALAKLAPDDKDDKKDKDDKSKDKSKEKEKDRDKEQEEPVVDNTKEREDFEKEKDDTRDKKEAIIQEYRKALAQPGANHDELKKETLIKLCALCHSTGQSFDVPLGSGSILQFKSTGDNDAVEIKIGLPTMKDGKTVYLYSQAGILPAKGWSHGHNPSYEKSLAQVRKSFEKFDKNLAIRRDENANPNKRADAREELKATPGMQHVVDLFKTEYPGGNEGFGNVEAFDDIHKGQLGNFVSPNDLTSYNLGKEAMQSLEKGFVAYAPPLPDDNNLKDGSRLLYKYVVVESVQANDVDSRIGNYDVYKQVLYQDKEGNVTIDSSTKLMTGALPGVIANLANTTAVGKWEPIVGNAYLRDNDNVPMISDAERAEDKKVMSCYYDSVACGMDFGYGATDKFYATPAMAIHLYEKKTGCPEQEAFNKVMDAVNRGEFSKSVVGTVLKETEASRGVEVYGYGENIGHVDALGNTETKKIEKAPEADIPSNTNYQRACIQSPMNIGKQAKAQEKDKQANKAKAQGDDMLH